MGLKKGHLWLEYWEERNEQAYDYDAEAEILRTVFEEARAKSILSLGCGSAPYLRRLGSGWFEGTGIDRDQALLDVGAD